MKKISILLAGLFLSVSAVSTAQEQAKKNYLPEEGDWALGFDVVPALDWFGNAFNHSENNKFGEIGNKSFTFDGLGNQPQVSILGKYMFTEKIAFFANIGLNINSKTEKSYVQDDYIPVSDNPLSEKDLIDKCTSKNSGASIILGAEYRKGSKRVQGIFGAGLLFAFSNQDVKYNWGNKISEVNQQPTVADKFSGNAWDSNGYRVLGVYNDGSNYAFGAVLHAGVEGFVAPKIAIGAQVCLSVYEVFGAQQYRVTEGFNQNLGVVEERTDLVSPGDRTFHLGTENIGARLYMAFYF